MRSIATRDSDKQVGSGQKYIRLCLKEYRRPSLKYYSPISARCENGKEHSIACNM